MIKISIEKKIIHKQSGLPPKRLAGRAEERQVPYNNVQRRADAEKCHAIGEQRRKAFQKEARKS